MKNLFRNTLTKLALDYERHRTPNLIVDTESSYDDYGYDARDEYKELRIWKQLKQGELQCFNDEYVKAQYQHTPVTNKLLARERIRFIEECLEFRDKKLGKDVKQILDFGCGVGEFANELSKRTDILIHQTDKNNYLAKIPKVSIELALDNKYDLVTMFDVLPTLFDFGVLPKLNTRLLCVTVPCCHYWTNEEWFMNWEHRKPGENIWHFNLTSLNRLMDSCGFEFVKAAHNEDKIRTTHRNEPNILTAFYQKQKVTQEKL